MSRRLGLALSASLLFPAMAAGQVPIGAEFRVNSQTTHAQDQAVVAVDPVGNFVAVWRGYGQDGSGTGIFAQRYDSAGTPAGGEFRVNTYTTSNQSDPAAAADPAGNFVIAWASYEDGNGQGIFARRYTAAGSPAGLPFRVNTYVTGNQSSPAVAVDAAGNFVVTWMSFFQDGSGTGIFAQRYDSAGAPAGGEFAVSTFTPGPQWHPATAKDADGDFVVVWTSFDQDGSDQGVFGQRFSNSGSTVGPEFRVNAHTTGRQAYPRIASDPNGGFVVAWASSGQDGSSDGVFARRYDAAGVPLGGEFQVNVAATGRQALSSIAMQGSGAFTIAWHSSADGSNYDVFARRYDALGAAEGPEFQLNAYTTGHQTLPWIGSADDGTMTAVWDSQPDSPLPDVVGRRFLPDLIFRDDFETGSLGVWSASSADGGDLTISTDAALGGSTAGLRGVVDDTAGLYVQDDRPNGENHYRARFYFDPNAFDPGEALNHRRVRLLLAFAEPNRRVAAVVLRRISGVYSVMARARLDDNTQADTGFQAISDGPHVFEIDLVRSSGPDANNGSIAFFVDGLFSGVVFGLDNSLSGVDFARLGAMSVKTGATGTMYWDQFVSRRLTYTGP